MSDDGFIDVDQGVAVADPTSSARDTWFRTAWGEAMSTVKLTYDKPFPHMDSIALVFNMPRDFTPR